ncbi:MAG: molybdopterin-dependent oxidoreductase [Archangium sp.]|nr:molybdopterin-dependent oxidoreductase [Archangium sp.]MDP3570666.1 molybdopterin-dependent oxidoreductase [Archangium sp.]
MPQLHYRACNLCEAICGLAIEHEDGKILGIRGDRDDPFSRGHICPKAVALKDVYEDPDRLRHPVRRDGDRFVEVSWEEAFTDIGQRLRAIRAEHGNDSVALSQGNPVLHNYGASIYAQTLLPWALGTRNRFSSTSVDNLPRMLVSRWMYGNQAILPVPDLDRTSHFLILGANPMASNGSVMTAPDLPKRLKALRERGGKIIVLDPRRTETANVADEHHFIRPGTDALFLLGFLNTLFTEGLVRLRRNTVPLAGVEALRALVLEFTPERVAAPTGISANDTRRLARDFAAAPSAVCYGRMGVSAQEFGLLATWLIDVINVVTGNLDREGGPMFTSPAVDLVAIARHAGQPGSFDAFRSRVRDLPEFNGELPISTMADELETEGAGQVRALLITAHNPVLSAPNGRRLDRALSKLELMVAVDLYVNETTRHAHYILPSTTTLEHDHYDLALHAVGIRNTTRWNGALFEPAKGLLHDWQIFLRLIAEITGGVAGRAMLAVGNRLTPRTIVDLLLRAGPTKFTVKKLEALPHGVDLGPLVPRLKALGTTVIELTPEVMLRDVARLRASMSRGQASLSLIGRRDLRSNNSWMHNSQRLVKGRPRCVLYMHPDDAAPRGLENGETVAVRSRVGEVRVVLEVTDAVMPGVVSLPHGWGHDRPGVKLGVAQAHSGVSANDLTDEELVDQSCGTAVLNGVSVEVTTPSP